VHALLVGGEKARFGTTTCRRHTELRTVEELKGGRIGLVYAMA
jgi:hypothetical protein